MAFKNIPIWMTKAGRIWPLIQVSLVCELGQRSEVCFIAFLVLLNIPLSQQHLLSRAPKNIP